MRIINGLGTRGQSIISNAALLLVIACAWTLCPFAHTVLAESGHRSIHQKELEMHREEAPSPTLMEAPPVLPVPEAEATEMIKKVFGYYPYWVPGFDGFPWDLLSTVAYFSAEVDSAVADGSLGDLHGWGVSTALLISTAHAAGVKVVLTVTCFDGATISSVLGSAENRSRLTDNLLALVSAAGGDGVNIDFEGVPAGAANKTNLVNLMAELTDAFHAGIPGSEVTMATPAVDWYNVFDYHQLVLASDGLVIMGYDYHWAGTDPGPVSPLAGSILWGPYSVTWTVDDYLASGGEENRDRFLLGLPFYGYDWPSVDFTVPGTATGSGVGIRYESAKQMADTYGTAWDENSQTPFLFYSDDGPHQVWYDDAESLSLKFDLVLARDLGGIGIWALNYEGDEPELWDAVRDHFQVDPSCPDVDGDGYRDSACGGNDCHDGDPAIHPGAAEVCGNGADDDCDGLVDDADPECAAPSWGAAVPARTVGPAAGRVEAPGMAGFSAILLLPLFMVFCLKMRGKILQDRDRR